MPGQRYQKVDESTYSNAYNWKLLNKTAELKSYQFKPISPSEGLVLKVAGTREFIEIAPSSLAEGAVILELDRAQMTGTSTDIEIGVYEDDVLVDVIETGFTGPLVKPKK